MHDDLENLRKERDLYDEQKQAAESARNATERARALTDEELALAARTQSALKKKLEASKKDPVVEFLKRYKGKPTDSDSDSDTEEPQPKKAKTIPSEFNPDGTAKSIPKYEGMNLDGLVLMKRVGDPISKQIGRNEFFPLVKMYTGEEVTTSQLGHVVVTTTTQNVPKQITKKAEFFFLLYNFGQYYLQLFLHKAASFLEYLAFLSKICENFTVSALVELDNQIRREYVQNTNWNWDQSNSVIDKIFTYFARDPSNLQGGGASSGFQQKQRFFKKPAKANFHPQSVLSKAQPNVQMQRYVQVPVQVPNYPLPGFSGYQALPQNIVPQQPKGGKRGGGKPRPKEDDETRRKHILAKNPNIVNERCSGYNFSVKGCTYETYLRLHVCYNCGAVDHKAPQCTLPRMYPCTI